MPSSLTRATPLSEDFHVTLSLFTSCGDTFTFKAMVLPIAKRASCLSSSIAVASCVMVSSHTSDMLLSSFEVATIFTWPRFKAFTLPLWSTDAISSLELLQITSLLSALAGVTAHCNWISSPVFMLCECVFKRTLVTCWRTPIVWLDT